MYVCDKVTILGRTISVAEDPLCPAEPLSRGQRNWPLSDSYNLFGLCNSLRAKRGGGRVGPEARSHPEAGPVVRAIGIVAKRNPAPAAADPLRVLAGVRQLN